jgi:pimeloyl-ACP methyl ester carboxylesterase
MGLLTSALPATATALAVAGPVVPVLRWHRCNDVKGFDCATARVPLDYRHPRGVAITLAVIKRPATDRAGRIGALFFNPGGPGGAGTVDLPAFYGYFPAQLRKRFDIISFDPRGIGASTAVQCFPTRADEAAFFSTLPAGFPVGRTQEQTWFGLYALFGQQCQRRNAALLSHVSTADAARDMNLLRRAVGDLQLNYLGVSYGSYLGATYANLFPGKVRAMVLDGNVDPVAYATPQRAGDVSLSTGIRLGSDVGAAATLAQFLDLCGQSTTSRCTFSAGSARATQRRFDALLQRLAERPVTITIPAYGDIPAQGPITFTYATLVSALAGNLFTMGEVPGLGFHGWSYGAFVLQRLWAASTPSKPTPSRHTSTSSVPHPTQSMPVPAPRISSPLSIGVVSPTGATQRYAGPEQGYAVECADSPNPRNLANYRALAAFADARSGPVGPNTSWTDEPCATWPATDAAGYFGPWNRSTANPILVVGNIYDPSTPYQGAVAMASALARARLLTVEGYGHTALLNPSSCVNDYESSYFVAGTLPPAGAVCQQNRRPFTR